MSPARALVAIVVATMVGQVPWRPLTPRVDYHRHLQSAAAAQHQAEPPLPAVDVPDDLARLLSERSRRWDDAKALGELYTDRALLLDPAGPRWLRGRSAVAARVADMFSAPYELVAVAWSSDAGAGHISGYVTRRQGSSVRYLAHLLLSLVNEKGTWRIAAETPAFGGPVTAARALTAEHLVSQLDEARTERAVVLSVAYWFGRPGGKQVDGDEYALVRAENDWTAAEAARFPDRLVAFCSFNPLKDYALAELERCAAHPRISGLKLHFANSGVDVLNVEHVSKLRPVFRAANRHRLPIVAHVWVPGAYGREQAEVFLTRILPEAPDIVVQIAHFAGGGQGYTDEALAVFADAVAKGDPRMRRVYFDATAVADGNPSAEMMQRLARRIRQIGAERVLFGSDMAAPPAWEPWTTFRMRVPLSEQEFTTIADNVAPYLRSR